MRWAFSEDNTPAVITAEKHVRSSHGSGDIRELPETCVIFELGIGLRFLKENFDTVTLYDRLPCFLDNPEGIAVKGHPDVCFTKGGYGCPAAVDTLETVRALGVKRILVVGMCGGFGKEIQVGDVVVPESILCEEGTSHHYFETVEFVRPEEAFFNQVREYFQGKFHTVVNSTVTTDSFYRQTFAKEAYWREKGCVGVDMEASALLSVSRYYSMTAAAVLLCSDKHPLSESESGWNWGNRDFNRIRKAYVRAAIMFALGI